MGGLAASGETPKASVRSSLSDEGEQLLRQGHGVEKIRLQRGFRLLPEMREQRSAKCTRGIEQQRQIESRRMR